MLGAAIDYFIVILHSPNGRQLALLAIRAVQRTLNGLWKTVMLAKNALQFIYNSVQIYVSQRMGNSWPA